MNITYRVMEEKDIKPVIQLYLEQYNVFEDGCWTEETAYHRIHQVWSTVDSYCVLAESEGALVGFVIGWFKQFDDLKQYHLEEIVIAHRQQGKGLGTALMKEIESRVKALGAAMIALDAVNDPMHQHFYEKLGYGTVKNFIPKTKSL